MAVVAFCVLAYGAFVTFLPKPPPKPDATWTHILQDGAFRVGIDPSFPPFEYEEQGRVVGFDAALAEELARAWSLANGTTIRVEYVYTGYDGLYDALKAKEFDAILSALPYDPRRTEDARFSHAYYNGGPLIIARERDGMIKTHYDLANRRVGVELGSTGDGFARRWQRRLKYDLRFFNSPADALRALAQNQVDGVFTDLIAFNDFAHPSTRSGQASGVRVASKPLVDELFVIAVRKNDLTLLAQINAVIDAMKKDGRMERMMQVWF